MADKELSMTELDRVFAGARAQPEIASGVPPGDASGAGYEALFARVMADAQAAMSQGQGAAPAFVPAPRPRGLARLAGLWSGLSAGFGGGGVVASLGAVALAALFLGYSTSQGLGEALLPPPADAGPEIEPVAIYFLAGG